MVKIVNFVRYIFTQVKNFLISTQISRLPVSFKHRQSSNPGNVPSSCPLQTKQTLSSSAWPPPLSLNPSTLPAGLLRPPVPKLDCTVDSTVELSKNPLSPGSPPDDWVRISEGEDLDIGHIQEAPGGSNVHPELGTTSLDSSLWAWLHPIPFEGP